RKGVRDTRIAGRTVSAVKRTTIWVVAKDSPPSKEEKRSPRIGLAAGRSKDGVKSSPFPRFRRDVHPLARSRGVAALVFLADVLQRCKPAPRWIPDGGCAGELAL